jgi:predicted AlkP superfamily phosphohydrolase/phosphomutase
VKVFVIGLDGATFDLIKPWTARGELPTFKMLMENGVHADLISTIPPVTSPAWPSFMTGKNPGKHGVFDFVGRSEGYSREIRNAKDIKAKTLWRLLSEKGKTCIVVNVPVTYPPEKIKGCIVTGMLTPPNACYVYPPEYYKEIKKIGYEPVAEVKKSFSPKEILEYLLKITSVRVETVLYLMRKIKWDFCMMVFRGTDIIQHHLWQYYKTKILQYYKRVDTFVKELTNKAGNEVNVILMSDHGFGPVYKFFHTNYFLHKLGLLEFKAGGYTGQYLSIKDYRSSSTRLQRIMLRVGITKEAIYTIAKKTRTSPILQKMYRKFQVQIPTTKKVIDWNKTKAFFNSSIGPAASIEINLEGREPKGIVKKREYAQIKEYILSELLKVKDPENGQKIVQDAFRREAIYHGPYLSEAPDIVFLTKNFEYAATDRIYGNSLVSEPIHKGRGTHRMNGIFIAYGPDIKSTGEELEKAHITDLAPTILHIFGLEIPEDMDGKVLRYIFKPNSKIAKRPIKYRKMTEKERISMRIRKLKIHRKIP